MGDATIQQTVCCGAVIKKDHFISNENVGCLAFSFKLLFYKMSFCFLQPKVIFDWSE